jgi:hypothetical protein
MVYEALVVATKEIELEVNADKTTVVVPLKGWQSSNIWEQR